MKGLFFFVLFSFKLNAAVDFNDGINPELAPSGRALAMGNAFTSAVNDAMASFYNPGGLGSIKKWQDKGLAKSDKIHFTYKGYKLIGDLLFEAIINSYGDYVREHL